MKRLPLMFAAVSLGLFSGVGSVAAAEAPSAADPAPPAVAQNPTQRVQAYVEPSIVYLQVVWSGHIYDTANKFFVDGGREFKVTMQCTGFVVNPDGYIATAGHCVDPTEAKAAFMAQGIDALDLSDVITVEELMELDIWQVDANGPSVLGRRSSSGRGKPALAVTAAWAATVSGLETGQALPARVLTYKPFDEGDAALLKVEATDLNAMLVSQQTELLTGTEIVSVGYPASVDAVTDPDLAPTYTTGSLGREETVGNGLLTVYTIDSAVSGGMSGGPTVDLQGRVLGLNSFGISGEPQQFNFIRPVSIIEEIMSEEGVENELGSTAARYRAGLDAYFAGDKLAAVRALRGVVREQPENGWAQDYLNQARALPNPPPPPSDFPVLPAAAGAVLLAFLAGGGIFLLKRQRASSSTASVITTPAAPSMVVPSGGLPGFTAGPTVPQPSTAGGTTMMPPQPPPAAANPMQVQPASGGTAFPTPPTTPQSQSPTAVPDRELSAAPAQPVLGPSPHAFCGSCGTKAHPGERFCGSCGAQL